jgi:formylmethanofuran dehydrogenase subunit A
MNNIIIKNGFVIDPLNNIRGEVMDIGIKNGKIVDPSEIRDAEATVIDANGRLVLAGAIDIHSHIAGPKVNTGRLMRPEDHYLTNIPSKLPFRRAMTGKTVPNVFAIGYKYALMGYTLVAEPACAPLKIRHAHEELNAIPMIDKMVFVLVDSNWLALDLMAENRKELLKVYLAWLLYSTKAYALKLVDPGSDAAWMVGKPSLDLDDQIPGYNLTPRDVIRFIGEANESLNLPHTIHVHCNRLGFPGNYITTLNTMKLGKDFALRNRNSIHITHVQFTGYGGDSWSTLESSGEAIANELNTNPYTSLDLGQVTFGEATTMTADAPFEFILYHLTRWKWANTDVENETASGIVPYRYRKKSYVNTIQWAIGLEVLLLSRDPWRTLITTDHPNAGVFTDYPKIFAWIMSRKYREETFKEVNQRALRKCSLPSIDREITLYELAIITRAAPAKLLGLEKRKGHLGKGADADIAIYDIDPRTVDLSKDYEKILKMFHRAWYVIKDGEIIVREGEIIRTVYGKTYSVDPYTSLSEDLRREFEEYLRDKFKRYYTVSLENFIVRDYEIKKLEEFKVNPMV